MLATFISVISGQFHQTLSTYFGALNTNKVHSYQQVTNWGNPKHGLVAFDSSNSLCAEALWRRKRDSPSNLSLSSILQQIEMQNLMQQER